MNGSGWFSFLSIRGFSSLAHTIHLVCSYWSFVLMSVHLGFHWGMVLGEARRAFGPLPGRIKTGVRALAALTGIYGIYAFGKREVVSYLFLRSHFVYFDYSEPYLWFLLDYISVMALFIWIGFGLSRSK